jgi:hypothetical protein
MPSDQLFEVVVGVANHSLPWRISKLSRRYWRLTHRLKQKTMPVIPVSQNHPAASAVCRRMPRAPICESPPRAAKTRADAVMHPRLLPPLGMIMMGRPQLLLPLLLRALVLPIVSRLSMLMPPPPPSLPPQQVA